MVLVEKMQRYTEKDLHNITTFENGLTLLESIGDAVMHMEGDRKINIVRNKTGEVEQLSPTFALTIEGLTEGAAQELCLDGHQGVVDEIIQKHEEAYTDDEGIEIDVFGGGEDGEE